MHLYRAVNSEGNTIDFYLSQRRNAKAAKRFLKKALASCHATKPRMIMADGDKIYPVAIRKLKEGKRITHYTPRRVKKYLNNIIEQEYDQKRTNFSKDEFCPKIDTANQSFYSDSLHNDGFP